MCVLGGGGRELLTPFFYLQITKRRLCGLVALADSCMPGQERSIHHHQDIGVGRCFDLGEGGGGDIINTGL